MTNIYRVLQTNNTFDENELIFSNWDDTKFTKDGRQLTRGEVDILQHKTKVEKLNEEEVIDIKNNIKIEKEK